MKTYTFEHDLKSKVTLKEISRPGIVDGLIVDNLGIQYAIVYWDSGERKRTWVFGFEIEPYEGTT